MALTYTPSSAGSTGNPPIRIASGFSPLSTDRTNALTGSGFWVIQSTCLGSDFAAAAAISDASVLGMKNGDLLFAIQATAGSTTPILQIGVVVSSAGSTGASMSTSMVTSTAA